MAAKAEKTEFIDNTARRKWDKEECVRPQPRIVQATVLTRACRYERRAKERAERDEAAVVEVICVLTMLPLLYYLVHQSVTDHVQVKNFSQSHVERAPLVERDYKVHTEDRVGKAVVIISATPKNEQGGFYCEVCVACAGARVSAADCDVGAQVCDCTLKDSVAWLDHINGKKHNRALGYVA